MTGGMSRSRWLFHPILILIFSILALGTSLFLYIYWYIEASTGLKSIVKRFNIDTDHVRELLRDAGLASRAKVIIPVAANPETTQATMSFSSTSPAKMRALWM